MRADRDHPQRPLVAVLTDLWPSRSQPYSGTFVRAQVEALGPWARQLVLVPRLLAPGLHRAVWGGAVNGWQEAWLSPAAPSELRRYPLVRIPRAGEAGVRAVSARLALHGARPGLVHGHFLYEVGVAAVRLARRLGVPSVVTVHGTDGRWLVEGGVQERHRRAMLEAARAADALLVVDAGTAERIVDLGVDAGRVTVAAMGVDPELFAPGDRAAARRELGVPADARLVLFVGRPTPEKGVDVLDRALGRLPADVRCVAVGPTAAGLARIDFAGPQPPARVARWLVAADVLCLPSHAEGAPVSVVEALACGRPVVATSVGAIPQQLARGGGIVVPPGDDAALAEGLRAALGREWSEAELRESSRRWWWSELAPQIGAVYERLLAR